MPCLNYNNMRNIFINELENIINNELYYLDNIDYTRKERIQNNIIKNFKNRISSNFIIEQVIHKDHCIHKYSKGNKEREYCCKKITINGDKNRFVCTKHNKNHIPMKRITKNNFSQVANFNKNSNIDKNIKNKNNNNNFLNTLNKNESQYTFTIKSKYDYKRINKIKVFNRKHNLINKNKIYKEDMIFNNELHL